MRGTVASGPQLVLRGQKLSLRQAKLAELISEGYGSERMARYFGISVSTVKNELTRLYKYLGIRSRVELGVLYFTETRRRSRR